MYRLDAPASHALPSLLSSSLAIATGQGAHGQQSGQGPESDWPGAVFLVSQIPVHLDPWPDCPVCYAAGAMAEGWWEQDTPALWFL